MKLLYILTVILFSYALANAEEGHDTHGHEAKESSHKHKPKKAHESHDHDKKNDHDDHDEHSEEDSHKHDENSHSEDTKRDSHDHSSENQKHDDHEEENDAIGPTKGILEKSESGFRLTDVAVKNFGLKYQKINSSNFRIINSAIVKILDSKYLFRERNGWFKKIPVKISGKIGDQYSVSIEDVKPQDKIIIAGVGFLRTAELVVEEGVADGHSH